MHISIDSRAMRLMRLELRLHEREETGGLLLGYRESAGVLRVLEAVDGGYRDVTRTENSFRYDRAYADHVCTLLSNLYEPPLMLLGVWHKHCHQMEPVFSLDDDVLHQQLARLSGGRCVSLLFQQSEHQPEEYRLRAFVIDADGGETEVGCSICG